MSAQIGKVSLLWDCAQLLGLAATAACLLLLLLPVRVRSVDARTLTLRHHEWLGWIVLIAALAHVLGLLLADPLVIEHLKRTAPLYEWAGIVSALLLLVLVLLAPAALRRMVWRNHRRFQLTHVVAACVLIPALAVHVLTTGHYVAGRVTAPLFLALCVLALLALLRPRRAPKGSPPDRALPHRLVFGRHSRKVLLIVAASLLVLPMLLSARALVRLRESPVARLAPVKVEFPHERHGAVQCVECHHNFIDHTGSGSCFACHRSDRPDLLVGAEARFHSFCLGCHRAPPRQFERTGPVTGCSSCHLR